MAEEQFRQREMVLEVRSHAGPILMQGAVGVSDHDTAETLSERILEVEHRIYPDALRLLATGAVQIDGDICKTPDSAGSGNFLISPGLAQWDLTLAKNTQISERLSVELRWEVYNVLNRANFSRFSLDNGINDSGFGTLTETPDVAAGNPVVAQGGPRNMNLALKIKF